MINRCETNISLLKMLKEAPNVTLSDRVYNVDVFVPPEIIGEIVNEVIKAYQQKLEQTKKEFADL